MVKKAMRKIALLAAVLVAILSFNITALAEDASEVQDGVKVTVKTDKESYKANEEVKLTVDVQNGTNNDLKQIKAQYMLPDTLSELGNASSTIDNVAVGETGSIDTTLKVASSVIGGESEGGIDIKIIIGVAVAVVVIILVVLILIISKKKKAKKIAAGILAGIIGVSSLTTTGLIAEADTATAVTNANFKRVSVHDPSIVKDPESGNYYIFGSHKAFASSEDLMSWKTVSNNVVSDFRNIFAEGIAWSKLTDPGYDANGNMWAPDVVYNKEMKKWCMYMSVNGDKWHSSIALATSDSIDGPYEYAGTVVWSGMDTVERAKTTDLYDVIGEGQDIARYNLDPMNASSAKINAIDPNVLYDKDGKLWMVYGSWSAGIYIIELDETTGLRDYNVKYDLVKNESDPYLGTKLAGGCYVSGEGPYIIRMGDYYYLFLSYSGLSAVEGYQMRVFRSETIDGEYVDQNGKSAKYTSWIDNKTIDTGYKIFGSYSMSGLPRVQVAQGHNSAFTDDDGKTYLVYHTRFEDLNGTTESHNEGHEVRVHQMFLSLDGWPVATPYEYSGETLPTATYEKSKLVGKYELIKHTTSLFYSKLGSTKDSVGIVGNVNEAKSITVLKEVKVGDEVKKIRVKVNYNVLGGSVIELNEDGSITGVMAGSWEVDAANNITITSGDITYKGVFIEQANEIATREQTMTFTTTGNNLAVWGIKVD